MLCASLRAKLVLSGPRCVVNGVIVKCGMVECDEEVATSPTEIHDSDWVNS